MAKNDIAGTTMKIHALLKGLADPADRQKAITAALTLLGDVYAPPAAPKPSGGGFSPQFMGSSGTTAVQYFEQKQPKNKVEELAVAARFRETTEGAESHTKDQLAQVIKAARRNFDANNFTRDMGNAKTAKLFTLGKENALSYAGQQFVDALPDRQQATAARRKSGRKPRKSGGKAKE